MARNVNIRMSLQDGDTVKRALLTLGAEGEAALKRIERGGKPASAGLKLVDTTAKEARDSLEDLATRAGAGGNVLRTFGPAGLAAAAGLGAVVIGVGAVISKARDAADAFDNLQDSADRVGVGTEYLQGLRFAVGQAGGDIEKVETTLDRLNTLIGDVARGGGTDGEKAFKLLGVSVTDAEGKIKSLERILPEIADGFRGLSSASERASIATDLFGKGNQSFARVLVDGADALRDQIQLARDMGAVVDEELVRKGAEAKDKIEALAMVVDAQLNGAVVDAAPLIVKMGEAFAGLAHWLGMTADAWKDLPDQRIETLKDTLSKLREELSGLEEQRAALASGQKGSFFHSLGLTPDLSDIDDNIAKLKARIEEYQGVIDDKNYQGFEGRRGQGMGIGDPDKAREFSAAVQETIDKLKQEEDQARRTGAQLAVYNALIGHENASQKERAAISAQAIRTYEAEEEKTRRQKAETEAAAEAKKKLAEAEREHQRTLREGERMTEQLGSAEEKRAARLREINELLAANAISEETARRAREAVEDDYLDDQTDFSSGVRRGLRNIGKDVGNTAEVVENSLSNAFSNGEDALVKFAQTGKLEFGDLIDSMIADLARLAIRLALSGIFDFVGGSFGGGLKAGVGPGTNGLGGLSFGGPRAGGGPVWPGSMFKVGEREPEWFIPNSSGTIVPASAMAGRGQGYAGPMRLNLSVRNEASAEPSVTRAEQRGDDFDIDLLIERKIDQRLAGPETQRLLGKNYGLGPTMTRR